MVISCLPDFMARPLNAVCHCGTPPAQHVMREGAGTGFKALHAACSQNPSLVLCAKLRVLGILTAARISVFYNCPFSCLSNYSVILKGAGMGSGLFTIVSLMPALRAGVQVLQNICEPGLGLQLGRMMLAYCTRCTEFSPKHHQ